MDSSGDVLTDYTKSAPAPYLPIIHAYEAMHLLANFRKVMLLHPKGPGTAPDAWLAHSKPAHQYKQIAFYFGVCMVFTNGFPSGEVL